MSKLLEKLSQLLEQLEAAGGYELAEGGDMLRRFIQRESLLTLPHDGQVSVLLELTSQRDWAGLKKLAIRSPFADVRQGASQTIAAYFPDGD